MRRVVTIAVFIFTLLVLAGAQSGAQQQPAPPETPKDILIVAPIDPIERWLQANPASPHRFWDTQNSALMVAGGALRAGDIWTTRRFLARGGHEAVLPEAWVRSDAKFIAYHAAGQAIFMLTAWALHRTRHHRLERIALWAQAGITAGFVIHNELYTRRLERP